MLSRLKRVIGSKTSEAEDEQESADPQIIGHRVSYRSFVDDNGWATLAFWRTSEIGPWRDLPVTREEVRTRMGPKWPPGYYKLFPVDEHGRLRSAEWSISLGTEEEARLRKELQKDRQSKGAQDESEGGSVPITPAMVNRMQEAMASIEWPEDQER